MKKIIQIMPATGWKARYKTNDKEGDILSDITCFALCEMKDGSQEVRGMDGGEYIDFCDNAVNFTRYEFDMEGAK